MATFPRLPFNQGEKLLVSWQREIMRGHSQVYLLTARGLQQLTQNTGYDNYAGYWAADGQSCFVTTHYGDNGHLYLYSLDGARIRELAANGRVKTNLWLSPDGSYLAYWEHPPQQGGGLVIHQPANDERRVVQNEMRSLDWHWSGDSQSLAGIMADSDNIPTFIRYALDGSELERFPLPHLQDKRELTLSLDWQRIAYIEEGDSEDYDLIAAKLDGSETHRFGILNDMESPPVWSPDSSQLAWVGLPDDSDDRQFSLYVAQADGTARRKIMTLDEADDSGEVYPGIPVWSPDGQSMAISSFVENATDDVYYAIHAGSAVFVVDVKSGTVHQVTDAAGIIFKIHWQPPTT